MTETFNFCKKDIDVDVYNFIFCNCIDMGIELTNEFTVTINDKCIKFIDANNKKLFKILWDEDNSFCLINAYLRLLHNSKEKEQK